ncbi:ligase-associated DNA damage response endonuclease PdeM [Algicella marina]|uniref:Ligase-associated DNA damage response endonuclease PdeM n=1 Tax=Algicella marina TaxID=2683284 RepID=A0A6P1T7F4_9RHOB|nr:ligase-associated DNA damage response endonuclease PdeM [Algicella marina]QHQ37219.1 ligase-associated DNA damage response endonuclease PdeM [Algicella marina]
MSSTSFTLQDARLTARGTGSLWWEDARLLCVSDLHLGKAERMARRGGTLLPPYDTRETLARLNSELTELEPQTVICLGDSFDDGLAAEHLDESDRIQIGTMMAGRRWFWVEGNHDPGDLGLGGTAVDALERGPLTFRHIAQAGAQPGEVSGHYHPKIGVHTRAGRVTRPCFVYDTRRLILPAFGAYTGGLSADDPALNTLFGSDACCILTGRRTSTVPLDIRQTA